MKVEFVDGDDWKGLYIDGKLVHEGHHIDIRDFIDCLKYSGMELPFEYKETYLSGPGIDELQTLGRFPKERQFSSSTRTGPVRN